MTDIIKLLSLVVNIAKSPIRTIKSIDILSYDKDAMLRLFSIASACLGILSFLLSYKQFFIGLIVIGILAPFIMFLVSNVSVFLYYVSFKLLGRDIRVNYEQLKTLLYPIFLTMIFMGIITLVIEFIFPLLGNILRNLANMWIYIVVFFVSRYKLKQSIGRSIMISIAPLLIMILVISIAGFINN